jgi:hypothetical protein
LGALKKKKKKKEKKREKKGRGQMRGLEQPKFSPNSSKSREV